jgi:predicted nuclease of restriction endonuclease-like (RecB) superfamily
MSNKITTKNYNSLLKNIEFIIEASRENLVRKINTRLTLTYWKIGQYLVQFEQQGKQRAKYGTQLLKRLSNDLIKNYGKGFSVQNLERMRLIYNIFPNSSTLLRNLSWSHLIRLSNIKEKKERNFYAIESIENSWSIRELDRQINSSLYERLALSKSRRAVPRLSLEGQKLKKPIDALKDPYVLEFLDIKQSENFSESDLESAIISNLQMFLLELGKGFLFIARQKRISTNLNHFFIDLVFYNRLLQCFVLIDLKIGKITHKDLGQMQMYVNYYDRDIRKSYEKPTVGIILCKEKNDFIVKYTLPENNNQIFTKEYKLYLPKKSEFKAMLDRYSSFEQHKTKC